MDQSIQNSRVIAWTVWMVASIFYFYQYILRVIPNIMLADIMEKYQIGAATFGQFSGMYYIGYSLMHLPIGLLLDRFGPRKMLTGCILLTVVGVLPLIFSDHWIYPIAGRILIGIGSSGAILGVFKVIRMMFHQQRFSRMLSFSVTIGLIGAIYGGAPLGYLRNVFGFHTVVQLIALIGIVLAMATYGIIPQLRRESQTTAIADIKEILSNRKVMLTCLFAGLLVGPLEGFADVWGTAFFKAVYGFDSTLAASLPSLIFVGMCLGAPFLSLIAEKIGNYYAAIMGAGIVMALSFILLLIYSLAPGVLGASFILVGIACAYQILAIHKASTYVRDQIAGLATAIANMTIMIFGYAFHTVIGNIINFFGGAHSERALIYGIAVIPVAVCMGTGGFSFLFFKEKMGKKVRKLL